MNFLKRFFRLKHSYLVLVKRTYIELNEPIEITGNHITLDGSNPSHLIQQLESMTKTKHNFTEREEWVHEDYAHLLTIIQWRK